MEATEPFVYCHVRENNFPSVVKNLNRASVKLNSQNRLSRECPSECASECPSESQRLAVRVYAVEDDYWCLRCAYFPSDDLRRYKHNDRWVLSSAKSNDMELRLAHFNMSAAYEKEPDAQEKAPNFFDLVETINMPIHELKAWSQRKALSEATQSLSEATQVLQTLYTASVYTASGIVNDHNITIDDDEMGADKLDLHDNDDDTGTEPGTSPS
jgi:hypothetical protein